MELKVGGRQCCFFIVVSFNTDNNVVLGWVSHIPFFNYELSCPDCNHKIDWVGVCQVSPVYYQNLLDQRYFQQLYSCYCQCHYLKLLDYRRTLFNPQTVQQSWRFHQSLRIHWKWKISNTKVMRRQQTPWQLQIRRWRSQQLWGKEMISHGRG